MKELDYPVRVGYKKIMQELKDTNMAEPVKKTLYHSEAVSMGAVQCFVKSGVTKSKYEGKPPFVVLVVNGAERNYTVENDACGAALAPLNNRKVSLEFLGGRDDATIRVLGQGAAQEPPAQAPAPRQPAQAPDPAPPQGQRQQAQRPDAPKPTAQAQHSAPTEKDSTHKVAQRVHLMFLCLKGAFYAVGQAHIASGGSLQLSEGSVEKIAVSLYMDAQRDGLHHALPPSFKAEPPKGGAK